MTEPRSLANHARYLASVQLAGWETALGAAERPAWIVDAAFAPALQLHLRVAYGWLLLAAARTTPIPVSLPGSVAELPPPAQGLSLPAEVERCRVLEQSGWLADLLAPLPREPKPAPSRGILAASTVMPDIAAARAWCAGFDELLQTIDHAIDES